MAGEHFRFVLPGRLEYREAAKAFLACICDQLAARHRLPDAVAHQVISAFVEAFNNAVVHAYRDNPEGSVEVELDIHDLSLTLRVIDFGASFRPDTVPPPDLDALPEGGMGLFIMRSFMDRVDYARDGDRNILSMQKTLGPRTA